jgi:hypothetical protein
MKIVQQEQSCSMWMNRHRHNKLMITFRNFVNACKNHHSLPEVKLLTVEILYLTVNDDDDNAL